MEYFKLIANYISEDFEKVTALSNLALAVASAFVSLLTLWLTYIILRFTAQPRIGIRLEKHQPLTCADTVDLCFTVFNKGHWYGRPPATGVRIYFNFSAECRPKCVRYGSALELSDSELKRGKGGHVYLRAKGITLFYEEPGESVVVTLELPREPGKYSLRIAMSSEEGGYIVYRQTLKVVERTSSKSKINSVAPLEGWGFQIAQRFDNPIITPSPNSFLCPVRDHRVAWEKLHTFNPGAVVREDKVFLFYRAEDESGDSHRGSHTSRIGLAESIDGTHFKRRSTPILYPAPDEQHSREWPGGCEDPRIVEAPDGTYILTYTQWDRRHGIAAIATSSDLIHWKKHGPVFADFQSSFGLSSYKSAGVLTELKDNRLIAAKLGGQYWMYWGEGNVHLAVSSDLLHWIPVRNSDGSPTIVLAPRSGRFDSGLVEVGVPPVVMEDGILLMYNGMNSAEYGDPALKSRTYSAGQALFDRGNPVHLLARGNRPLLQPEFPFESTGQYAAGTTFVEGLVFFKGTYFLYFGAADSLVAVATLRSLRTGPLESTDLKDGIEFPPRP